ncbi:MAG: hypothetical protein EA369_01330 [Bradymonadales bacterium]|nr:MAG: hypothetical protein EA369_01330 [Bradymonadales bacterium]
MLPLIESGIPVRSQFFALALLILSTMSSSAIGQGIVLRDAREAAIPIAIQNFRTESEGLTRVSTDLEASLTANLIFSRLFRVIPSEAIMDEATKGELGEIQVGPWRQTGAQFVVRASVSQRDNETSLKAWMFRIHDGRKLFEKTYSTRRTDYEVLAHQLGDDIVQQVTGEPGLFSTKIAFVYQAPNSRHKEIWVMDFNGRNPEPLIQNNRTNLSPTWTLDGQNIIFSSASLKGWDLWRFERRRNRSTQLTNFPGSALGPSMHPNGREMVVALSKDGESDLYLLDMNGRERRRLTRRSEVIDLAPSFSPDGNFLCFSSGRMGALHVFRMELQSLQSTRLTRVGTLNDSCAWHPKENTILFQGMDVDREFDIFSMNHEGNQMSRITFDARHNETPSWSPDGQLVVFSSRRSGRNEIHVMKADGSQVTKITNLPGEATMPSWSPRLGY